MNFHLFLRLIILSFCLLLSTLSAHAISYTWKDHNDVVGQLRTLQIQPGDNFFKIARRYDVGFYELIEANPHINPENPQVGSLLIVPTEYVLPAIHQKNPTYSGIVINLAEMRLYFFPVHSHTVYTFPIGIGRQGWSTPTGSSTIIEKRKNPYWVVPTSIRKSKEAEGIFLPRSFPPGGNNPLGDYAMRLSWHKYLIHGTNVPQGVGRRSSSGCIRMLPEDIKQLFSMVPLNTHVQVVNSAYKFGWNQQKLFLEAHIPLQETMSQTNKEDLVQQAIPEQLPHGSTIATHLETIYDTINEHLGIPLEIRYIIENKAGKYHASMHTFPKHQNP